jgi:phosphate transport system substrate-binding protein
VLVQGVQRDKFALGYFGFAYYTENQAKLKAVPIVAKAGAAAVAPSMETVIKGTYQPLARPIFIYINAKSLERPEIKEFVAYYMTNGAKLAREVKYVPLPAESYKLSQEHVNKMKLGTVFGGVAEVGVTIEELLRREAKL